MDKKEKYEVAYHVVYSKMGKVLKDSFANLNDAIKDFNEKKRLDKLGYFDDRFVIRIEDNKGKKIDIPFTDVENQQHSYTKNLAIITARGGSKRIPKKNIKLFCGKPIIAYSIEAALSSGLFDEVMVSTDDEEIRLVAEKYGATVPFLRSEETANDYAGLSVVIEEVKNEYQKREMNFDFVCCILPTAPLISVAALQKGFALLKERKADVILPVVKFSYPIQRAFKMTDDTLEMFYPEFYEYRSQDLEPAYHDSGQFYWMKYDKSLKSKNKLGYEISEIEAQDIDTESDWKLAELKYKLLNNTD
ncbi:MAG TPA: pseudaminic acid cytidylyltransferase [Rhodothermales bacterium]|nr:pseudaminic acid cytidylyltransferase [Rhodothermales bacterium]